MDIGILERVDQLIEGYYGDSVQIGKMLASVFDKKHQVRSLENIIYTSTRFTEIPNFIKNQMGKDSTKHPSWTKKIDHDSLGNKRLGEHLLNMVERIDADAAEIAGGEAQVLAEVRLRLARGWIRQVSAHYEYELIR